MQRAVGGAASGSAPSTVGLCTHATGRGCRHPDVHYPRAQNPDRLPERHGCSAAGFQPHVPPASPSRTSSRAWPALRRRLPSPTPAARPWPTSASPSPGGAPSYSVSPTACAALLDPNGNCTAQVVFTPSATGCHCSHARGLLLYARRRGLPGSAQRLRAARRTASPRIPISLTFAVIAVGQTSAAQSVTITNSTSYAIGSVAVWPLAPFNVSQNGCTGSLAAGANCTAQWSSRPPPAARPAARSPSAPTPSPRRPRSRFPEPASISLSPSQALPARPWPRARQANYTLVLTPIRRQRHIHLRLRHASYGRTLSLQPHHANAQCRRAGQRPSRNLHHRRPGATGKAEIGRPDPARPGFWRALPLTCGLLLLPLAIRRRRKIFQLALLLAVLASGITSCTSSGDGASGGGGSGGNGRRLRHAHRHLHHSRHRHRQRHLPCRGRGARRQLTVAQVLVFHTSNVEEL